MLALLLCVDAVEHAAPTQPRALRRVRVRHRLARAQVPHHVELITSLVRLPEAHDKTCKARSVARAAVAQQHEARHARGRREQKVPDADAAGAAADVHDLVGEGV